MGSNTPGQYDQQMSLQLYGNQNTGTGATTQASTIPTQNASKKGKKLKGHIKGIPTNSKQLQSKKPPTAASGAAFEQIQKRIKD